MRNDGPGRPRGGRGRRTGGAVQGRGGRFLAGSAAGAGAAALLCLGFATGAVRLEPRGGGAGGEGLGEVWLLTVFTGGVLSILFGFSAWLGQGITGRGAREGLAALRARMEDPPSGAEARLSEGADPGASEVARAVGGTGSPVSPKGEPASGTSRIDPGWFVAVGGWLLLLYAAGWRAFG